uniref:ABCA2 n=1 Tax=Poecilia formosa TaxID=48698 RepID=A0A096MGE2_POEFO
EGFPLAAVLKNQEGFQQFLVRNLSLSNSTASTLLNSSVNLQEVYSLIFDSSLRDSGGPASWIHGPKILSKKPADKLLQIKEKLLGGVQSMDGGEHPGRAANRKAVVQIVSWALGLSAASGSRAEQLQGIQELEGVLLTGSMLKFLTCGERGDIQLRKILLVPEKQQPGLQAYHSLMCSREEGQRSERFRQLSKELREQINTQSVADQAGPVAPLSQSQLGALLKDLADVERLLKDVDLLSGLARLLPKGACAGQNPVSTSNGTWPLNTTTWSINTTDVPRENPHSQFSAFVQLWAGLQPILCGNNRIIEPEALKQGNMSSLGFTSKEQRNLGLLVHLMTTNPKILYSPIGSQVDKVIQKSEANETFAFVGNVTHYTRVWLNISAQLRTFLEEGRLQSHLLWLQQLSSELQQQPELLNGSDSELMQALMMGNYTLPNTSTLLEQLDTIDNAACGWIRFMSKVSTPGINWCGC